MPACATIHHRARLGAVRSPAARTQDGPSVRLPSPSHSRPGGLREAGCRSGLRLRLLEDRQYGFKREVLTMKCVVAVHALCAKPAYGSSQKQKLPIGEARLAYLETEGPPAHRALEREL